MKIAMCASEVVPFAKTGGLADVLGALPLALEELDQQIILVMPKYKVISDAKFNIQSLKGNILYSTIGKNIKVYFIKHQKYFNRDGLYQDKKGDYKDNLDRFAYYCRATLALIKKIDFKPDIIHCHDWQSALIPVYLKNLYKDDPFYKNTKTVLTIHNLGYQGLFPKEEFPKLGLSWELFNMDMLEFYGKINILKGGIVFSDLISTVSQTYSKEIQTKEFGFGLEGVLGKRKDSLFGILNGLDYSIWNPQNDKFITTNYSLNNLEDKYKNKRELQKICNLPLKKEIPLLGIVSRLAQQKGFDILLEAMEEIAKMEIQMVILGVGDLKYHQLLQDIARRFPKILSLHLKFDDPLAHKIYAGSDIFLMPSRYEPCGLGQMISLKYGTIPLVFKTGGLADTVNEKNGFVFENYTKEDLLKTIKQAIDTFKNKERWLMLMRNAMQCNFSWFESAKRYIQLYERATQG
ncbi:MAG: glycogen synthase GlgA [Candidatus Omnitrophica bacterium]|nr:glycogen synthase GlgA [Candidatus Omnitrophota bacterium]